MKQGCCCKGRGYQLHRKGGYTICPVHGGDVDVEDVRRRSEMFSRFCKRDCDDQVTLGNEIEQVRDAVIALFAKRTRRMTWHQRMFAAKLIIQTMQYATVEEHEYIVPVGSIQEK